MRQKLTCLMLVALLAGSVLVAIAPTAAAQQSNLIVSLTPPSENVKPLQGSIAFQGKATYTADAGIASNIVGVSVTYSVVNAPSWASVTITPQSDVFVPAGTGQTLSDDKTFTVIVSASDQAPAFQPGNIEIRAQTAQGQAHPSATGIGSVPIQAAFFSILDVQLAETIKVDRPQTGVAFPVQITNFGNAATRVNFEVLEQSPNLQTALPSALTLESRQAGGQQISSTVVLTVQTPHKNGYMNEVGNVRFKISSNYALDTNLKGDESAFSVLVTTKGFYVPGPSPLLLIGLLVVAAALFRRRDE